MNFEGVVAANCKDMPTQELFPGIRKRILWQGANSAKAQILEIDAGATFLSLDVHAPDPEEVFVVSGVFNDGAHDYPAGSFIHKPAGSSHVPQSQEEIVCSLVFFPED